MSSYRRWCVVVGCIVAVILSISLQAMSVSAFADATTESSPEVRAAIEAALAQAVAERPAWLLPGGDTFVLQSLHVDGRYGFLNAIRPAEDQDLSSSAAAPEDEVGDGATLADEQTAVVAPDNLLAVAVETDGAWIVYLEGTPHAAVGHVVMDSFHDEQTLGATLRRHLYAAITAGTLALPPA